MLRKLARWWNSDRNSNSQQSVSILRRLQAESIVAKFRDKQRRRKLARAQGRKVTALDETRLIDQGHTLVGAKPQQRQPSLSQAAGRDAGSIITSDVDAEPAPPSAGWFSRLFGWLRPMRRHFERRAEPRAAFGRHFPSLQLTLGVCGWPTAVTDVSRTGVGLIVGMWQKPGDIIKINLVDQGRGLNLQVRAKVHRVQPRPDGLWRLGCQFVKSLTEREFAALA